MGEVARDSGEFNSASCRRLWALVIAGKRRGWLPLRSYIRVLGGIVYICVVEGSEPTKHRFKLSVVDRQTSERKVDQRSDTRAQDYHELLPS